VSSTSYMRSMFLDTQELATLRIGSLCGFELDKKTGINSASGATYTGKWIAQSSKAVYEYNTFPKGVNDTYVAQSGYILSFDAQGGSPEPSTQLIFHESTMPSVVEPTQEGYSFGGWFTDVNGAGTLWYPGITKMPSNNVMLYANWIPHTYAIIFDGNGSTGGIASSMEMTFGAEKNLTVNQFTRTGYTFAGWAETPDGAKVYDNEAKVKNLSTVQGGTKTLFAHWIANSYTVIFDANEAAGSVPSSISATYDKDIQMPAQNDLTKPYYTFAGWNTKPDGSGKTYEILTSQINLTDEADGVVTLYAKWLPNTYIIAFNGSNPKNAVVTGGTDDVTATYDTPTKLPASGFVCEGYTFVGWNTDPKGTGTRYTAEQEVTNLTTEQNGVVTLYAEWEGSSSYTVSFDSNVPGGGAFEGTTPDKVIKFGVWESLPKNGYRCQGFNFKGWTVAQDGTGELYLDGQSVQNIAAQGSTSVKLYAQWAETYNVTVPVAPTISIDAQGQVSPDTTTDTFFRSNNSAKVAIARIESVASPNAQDIFPGCPTDGTRWSALRVTIADKAEPDLPVYVPTNGSAATVLEIPGNTSLPVLFGLKITPGTQIAYKEATTEVVRLSYVFAIVG
ncbi:MAG: InlB B-repeat-containing protein, partial [Raoultibacter sp.]